MCPEITKDIYINMCRNVFITETTPLDFTSKSHLVKKLENKAIKLPWTMSTAFRTVNGAGTIMELAFGNNTSLLEVSCSHFD
jgi:hypothetical protein